MGDYFSFFLLFLHFLYFSITDIYIHEYIYIRIKEIHLDFWAENKLCPMTLNLFIFSKYSHLQSRQIHSRLEKSTSKSNEVNAKRGQGEK